MTTTIETNNINILKKIEHLQEICEFLRDKTNINNIIFDNINEKIQNIMDLYSVESAIILSDYFLLISNIGDNLNFKKTNNITDKLLKQKEEYTKLYNRFIKQNNIPSKLDSIFNELREIFSDNFKEEELCENNIMKQQDNKKNKTLNCNKKIYKDIWMLFSKYKKIKINVQIEEIKLNNLCDNCNEVMMITGVNEQSCSKCGKCQEAVICTIDEDAIMMDSKNIKSGTYDPSKHCKYWIDRIQGRDASDMSDIYKTAKKVKELLDKDKIKNVDYITCELIRLYLRKCSKTSLNEHVPLIRKIITGITPPQLTEQELQTLNIYFIKIIKIYNTIKPPNKINCPYHPYIIFKILEQILPNNTRKQSILKCIHLQSTQTLIWNDKIWYDICKIISEDDMTFKYIATDRSK